MCERLRKFSIDNMDTCGAWINPMHSYSLKKKKKCDLVHKYFREKI